MTTSLKERTISGMLWSFVRRSGNRIISFASTGLAAVVGLYVFSARTILKNSSAMELLHYYHITQSFVMKLQSLIIGRVFSPRDTGFLHLMA